MLRCIFNGIGIALAVLFCCYGLALVIVISVLSHLFDCSEIISLLVSEGFVIGICTGGILIGTTLGLTEYLGEKQ